MVTLSQSRWLRGLRCGSAVRSLGLRVHIPSGAWVYISCECYVLSDGSLCDGQITWCSGILPSVCESECDHETSTMRRPRPPEVLETKMDWLTDLLPKRDWLTWPHTHSCYEECSRNFLRNTLNPAPATQWKLLKNGLTWKFSHYDRLNSATMGRKSAWNGSEVKIFPSSKVIQSCLESCRFVF